MITALVVLAVGTFLTLVITLASYLKHHPACKPVRHG